MDRTETLNSGTNATQTTATTSNYTTLQMDRTETLNSTQAYKGLSENPGLVAVLCIFISILCIAFVVTVVRFCNKPDPQFEKLDEVPMMHAPPTLRRTRLRLHRVGLLPKVSSRHIHGLRLFVFSLDLRGNAELILPFQFQQAYCFHDYASRDAVATDTA
ncbi:uncharacterized homolog [Engystomops pustulosus]|uniref:uncharacterized homolog n=1 Tax=Engystomops pustulosus TaxID=76066 RepID=UPI003AFB1C93